MARPKVRALALTLMLVLTMALAATRSMWGAETEAIHEMTFADLQRMIARMPSLLPVARLRNESAAHYLHVRNSLKWVTTLPITQFTMAPGNVNFRPGWHPKPYSTKAEDLAMFQLGMLAGYGHFAMVNGNIPEMRDYAGTILGELDTITSATMLADMNPGIKQIAQAVADPSYPGGPTRALDVFDKWTLALSTRIRELYFMDGYWYYAAGICLSGLNSIPQTDSFNAPYFRHYLELLYNDEPSTGVPYAARYNMAMIMRRDYFHGYQFGNQMDEAMHAMKSIVASR